MECLVCHREIKSGEHVFCGSQMACNGPGFMDFCYSSASDDFMVAMHLSCLENPAAIARMSNMVVSEPVEEEPESAVERSDALALFD